MNGDLEFNGRGYSPPTSHEDIGPVRVNETFRCRSTMTHASLLSHFKAS